MFFAAPRDEQGVLASIPGFESLRQADSSAAAEALEARFKQQPVAHWMSLFEDTSAGVVPLGSLHATRDESLQTESGGNIDLTTTSFRAVRHDQHPMGRWVDLVAPNAVRPQRATIDIPGPAPKYGQDTRAILARLGYDDADIQSMLEAAIVSESWSEKYLPE